MSDNGVLSVEERRQILAQMIREWQQQAFAAETNVKVARRLGDDRLQLQAVEAVRRAEGALAVLKEELAELAGDSE